MKHLSPRLLSGPAFALFTLSALHASYSQVPSNPVLPNADPFITPRPANGKYLLLATTGHNITIWSGKTVQTVATDAKVIFVPHDGMDQLWSPTIWQINSKWWIYFTAQEPGQQHGIFVLESDTSDPLGTYTFRGQLAVGHPAIDPSLLTVGGVKYLLFVSLDRGENAIEIVRMETPLHPAGISSLIAEPEYAWEKGAGSTKNYPVTEGPTALYHKDKTFIVYSGSDTASPAYCLGLLTLSGNDPLDRMSWKKNATPVFAASPANGIYGPGRGTFAHAEDGTDWLLYAAKTTDAPTSAHREIREQRFGWKTDGMPDFGRPTKDGPIP